MLIRAYGTSSLFGLASRRIMQALVEVLLPGCFQLEASTLEGLREAVTGRKTPSILLYAVDPDLSLVEVTHRVNPASVYFYEDPSDIVGFALRESQTVWPTALQVACKNIATVAAVIAAPQTLVIRRDPGLTLDAVISELCGHFGLPVTQEKRLEIAASLGIQDRANLEDPLEQWLQAQFEHYRPPMFGIYEVSGDVVELMETVYGPLRSLLVHQPVRDLQWPVQLFFSQTPQRTISGVTADPLSLLGPARYLYFGPYYCLPSGWWNLKVVFEVRENLSFNKVEIDVCQAGDSLSYGLFDIPVRGRFEIDTEIEIRLPEVPLEFRIFLKEGAIEGLLELKRVTWSMSEQPPNEQDGARIYAHSTP